ncbi:hypothetical protein HDV00_012287, partial [Rhizophlyctis rosea]
MARRQSQSICWQCLLKHNRQTVPPRARSASTYSVSPAIQRHRAKRPVKFTPALYSIMEPVAPTAPVNHLRSAMFNNLTDLLDAEFVKDTLDTQRIVDLYRDLAASDSRTLHDHMRPVWQRLLIAIRNSPIEGREERFQGFLNVLYKAGFFFEGPSIEYALQCLKPERLQTAQHAKLMAEEFEMMVPRRSHMTLRFHVFAELLDHGRAGEWKIYLDWIHLEYPGQWNEEIHGLLTDALMRRFPVAAHRKAILHYRLGNLSDEDKALMVRSAKKFEMALRAIEAYAVRDGKKLSRIYTQLVFVRCWELDSYAAVKTFLAEAKADGASANSTLYNRLLSVLASHSDTVGMERLFKEMRRHGNEADADTVMRIIGGYVKNNDLDTAYKTYLAYPQYRTELLRYGRELNKESENFDPEEEYMGPKRPFGWRFASFLLNDFNRPLEQAKEILFDLLGIGLPPPQLPGLLISRYIELGQIEEALRILQRFGTATKEGEPVISTYAMDTVEAFCRAGRRGEAIKLIDRLERDGVMIVRSTYQHLMASSAKSGDIRGVQNVLDRMAKVGLQPTEVTHLILLNAYVKGKKIDEAAALLNKLREEGLQPDDKTYNVFVNGLVHAGQFEEAEDLARDMERSGIVSRGSYTWPTIMNAYTRVGRWGDAFRVLKKITRDAEREIVREGGGVEGQVVLDPASQAAMSTVTLKVRFHSAKGDPQQAEKEALDWVTSLGKRRLELREGTQFTEQLIWNSIIMAYIKANDIPSATRVRNKMNERRKLSNQMTNNAFILHYGSKGDFDAAEEHIRTHGDFSLGEVYRHLISCAAKAHPTPQTERMKKYWHALTTATTTPAEPYAPIMASFIKVRDFTTAEEVYATADKAGSVDAYLMNTVLDMYAKKRDWKGMERKYLEFLRPRDPFAGRLVPDLTVA